MRDIRWIELEQIIERLQVLKSELEEKHPVSGKHMRRGIDRLQSAINTAYISYDSVKK